MIQIRHIVTYGIFASFVVTTAVAAEPKISVSESALPDTFRLATATMTADIRVDEGTAKVVHLAGDLLAADIERITGRRPTVGHTSATSAILIGTLNDHDVIDDLVASGKLDAGAIKEKWEAYEVVIVPHPTADLDSALVIAGSDRRGTAYGIATLSEAIGVSPWYWWADVAPAKKRAIYVSLSSPLIDAPAVKYRGIFINDEDWGLNAWASKTFDPELKNIGPKTYEKVFELMLRLKLNYIWPAMHACSNEFGADPKNAALADEYGIVAGASHCEPMLYNNVKWKEKEKGPWNYSTNRDAIHAVWDDSAKSRGNYEAVWTLGIRGIHDAAMEAPRDMKSRINILTDVIHDEREMLEQHVSKTYGPIAQCFVPYKEVQLIYDGGLKVPPDVTLVWADDNFGYIRRLSSPDERKRSGGGGVYYHLSYYGNPHSYTWINTTAPALMWEELHKAWDNDARTIWVLNVGDIKPAEIGISYYADLAWHANTFGADSQPKFLRDFAARTFGAKSAEGIATLLADYYRLGTLRKPELMDREWALSLGDDEAGELEKDYQKLLKNSESIAAALPAEAHDGYAETIGFPAHILGDTGLLFMADRRGDGSEVTRLRNELEAQVANYNTQLANGKWNNMMPGLETGKDLMKWSSQVRWPWGDKANAATTSPAKPVRRWRDAASADRNSPSQNAAWIAVPGLAPSGHALAFELTTPAAGVTTASPDGTSPTLEFNFESALGGTEAIVRFLPTFRLYPGLKLRVAVSIDDQSPQLVEVPGSSGAEDERGQVRSDAVQSNLVEARVALPALAAGKHVFRIQAVDPGAVIDSISLP